MTNNPTIDGVSRLLNLSTEAASTLLGMVEYCINHRVCMGMDEGFKTFEPEEEHGFVKELRALLDAPVVERQPVCATCNGTRVVDDGELTHSSGGIPYENGPIKCVKDCPDCLGSPEVAALQSTITQLRIDLGNQTELTKQADYHASQRGHEIAQLQARIAELESGRGEPFMYGIAQPDGTPHFSELCVSGEASDLEGEVDSMNYDGEGLFRVVALFTAPPAPVAVVLPELESAFEKWWDEDGQFCRAGGGSYEKTFAYRAYEACLDAAAALNKPTN